MSLRREFQQVRKTFFPRWDRAKVWKCRKVYDFYGAACCCFDTKEVKVSVVGDNLTLVLIHEICHAVGGTGHEEKWQRRMEKVAVRAERVGRSELAAQIREEIQRYQEMPIITAADVCSEIDVAIESLESEATLMQVAERVGHKFSISPEQVLALKGFKAAFAKRRRCRK